MDLQGVRSWLISCDESGVHGSRHYGFGSLWMRWQRRGDFINNFRAMREQHRFKGECKWNKVSSQCQIPFLEQLISYFFQRQWLVFHCLIVRRDVVRKEEFHKNDWDLARRKHFTMLLTNKMKMALRRYPDREQEFRVYLDPIASRYEKADEAVEVISNNILNERFSRKAPVKSVITRDSKETPSIQLCDLLLGSVMETWQQKATNPVKATVRRVIAKHLGWPELDSDTFKQERKFNIWYFHDPTTESRQVSTRMVRLMYPYPGV